MQEELHADRNILQTLKNDDLFVVYILNSTISEPDWSCSLVIPNGRIRVAPISLAYHEMV